MARAVLVRILLRAGTLGLAAAPLTLLANAATPACSPKQGTVPLSTQPEIRHLEQRVQAGVFYRELQSRSGDPLACRVQAEGGKITLTYAFRNRGQLKAQIDPAIESSEQRLQVRRMEKARALAVLEAAEKDLYRPNGCGIAWDRPPEESPKTPAGTHESVYRGTTCNCQGRLIYRYQYVIGLTLSSTC